MLYTEYIEKAKDICIVKDEDTGKMYLRPDYRYVMYLEGMKASDISDFDGVNDDMIAEHLKLFVSNNNEKLSVIDNVAKWVYDIISVVVDPALTTEENELMSNMMNYMKLNDSLKDKEKALADKEKTLDQKKDVVYAFPGIDFSKKKP